MVKKRVTKKHNWSPYVSDVERFSVYPKVRVDEEDVLNVGDTIEVYINSVDDRGKGLGFYKGFRIYVNDVNVGSKVKAVVKEVKGRVVYCEKIDVVEDGLEY